MEKGESFGYRKRTKKDYSMSFKLQVVGAIECESCQSGKHVLSMVSEVIQQL